MADTDFNVENLQSQGFATAQFRGRETASAAT